MYFWTQLRNILSHSFHILSHSPFQAGPWTPEATVEHPEAVGRLPFSLTVFYLSLNLTPNLLKKSDKKWQVRQLHREFLRAGSDVMQVTKDYRRSKSGKMEMSPDILFACECVHCAYLHCIVNVFRAWICSSKGIYSPKGVYQEILSLGQYFPIHSLGSRECIEKYALIQYRPC